MALGVDLSRWTLVRRLGNRHDYAGRLSDGRRGILKVSTDDLGVERLRNEHHWMHALGAIHHVERPSWFAPPTTAGVGLGSVGGMTGLLLPLQRGRPLGVERHVSAATARRMLGRASALVAVLQGTEGLGLLFPSSEQPDRDALRRRFRERVAGIGRADRPVPDSGELLSLFDLRLSEAALEPAFGHGEPSPWHILRDGERFRLIDLEVMSASSIRHVDANVMVMRLWALQGAHLAAEKVLRDWWLGLERGVQARMATDTAWMWLWAAVRTVEESRAWARRDSADAFVAQALSWARAPDRLSDYLKGKPA